MPNKANNPAPGERNEFTGAKRSAGGRHSPKGPLERSARVRMMLIRELADGTLTNASLAKKYDVSTQAVSSFKKRHAVHIEAVKVNAAAELDHLWIVKKELRIAAYQDHVDRIEDQFGTTIITDDNGVEHVSIADDKLMQRAQSALRGVAEELGQLPNRINLEGDVKTTVHYAVEGVDLGDLK